ncbi:retrovirus-related pol polyprotein from transposon TNT 1-94, partial [Tanacetum coccineum]
EDSRSKMLLNQSDLKVLEKKVNIKPINYAELNRLSEDFGKCFVPQQELYDEQAFRLQTSHPNTDQSASLLVIIEVPWELPKAKEHAELLVNQLNQKKFKGKDIVDNVAQVSNGTTIAPGMYKLDRVTLALKDKNNRETHIYYLKHTMEQVVILKEIVEQAYSQNPLDSGSYSACKYVKLIQELLGYVIDTCLDIHKPSEKLVSVTPINKKKIVRFAKPVISSRVSRSTKSSRSKSTDNTKNDRILQISSSTQKKNKYSKLNTNSELMCVKRNSSMFDARHEFCFLEFVSDMNASSKSKSVKKAKKKEEWKPIGEVFTKIGYNWRPTGRTFTLVGNACPLKRITATNKVPFREPIPLEVVAQESIVTKFVQIVLWYLDSGCSKHMTGDRSQLTNFIHKFLSTVKFGNDQIAKIMGYGDYQIGNITISTVYYVEGLGHNLFSVGQFRDSDLEVAFRKHTCFVRNLEGDDLLSGSRETNLYTLSIGGYDGVFSNLSLVQSLKDQILIICVRHVLWAKARNNHINLNLKTPIRKTISSAHGSLGPMRVASINGKKYILIIMDDYSRFTWTLRSYYESVGISHETSVARSLQQNGIVERRNRTLVEAARTMLIYAKAPLFLWAEAVATACYTQNRFVIQCRHGKTPYELLHDRKPDLSYHHVFGALCYPNNDSEDLGKLQAKVDIAMASEQLGSGPGLQYMTPATSRTRSKPYSSTTLYSTTKR